MSEPPYVPIACGLHDELQLLVLQGRFVGIQARGASGEVLSVEGRPTDVFTRDGAEWLALEDGRHLRLDRLIEVDGRPFEAAC